MKNHCPNSRMAVTPKYRIKLVIYIYWLVVKKNILKNDGVKVNGKDDIPYLKWKIIQMFETTNSYMLYYYIHLKKKIHDIWHEFSLKQSPFYHPKKSLALP